MSRKRKEKPPVPSEILIWNKETKFIKISEGSGDNLLREDIAKGFVDYMCIDGLEYDISGELTESYNLVEGGFCMLKELYQEKFKDAKDVIKYLKETDWIPDVRYTVLFAE